MLEFAIKDSIIEGKIQDAADKLRIEEIKIESGEEISEIMSLHEVSYDTLLEK